MVQKFRAKYANIVKYKQLSPICFVVVVLRFLLCLLKTNKG